LRHSRCCYGLIDVDMRRSSPSTAPTTPTIENNKESSALMKDYKTEPINIPKKTIFTRQNYL